MWIDWIRFSQWNRGQDGHANGFIPLLSEALPYYYTSTECDDCLDPIRASRFFQSKRSQKPQEEEKMHSWTLILYSGIDTIQSKHPIGATVRSGAKYNSFNRFFQRQSPESLIGGMSVIFEPWPDQSPYNKVMRLDRIYSALSQYQGTNARNRRDSFQPTAQSVFLIPECFGVYMRKARKNKEPNWIQFSRVLVSFKLVN